MSVVWYFRRGNFEHLPLHLLCLGLQPLNYLGVEQNADILSHLVSIYPLWKAAQVDPDDGVLAGSPLDDGRAGLPLFGVDFVVNLFVLGLYLQDEFLANLSELSDWQPCVVLYLYLWLFRRVAENGDHVLSLFDVGELVQGEEGMGEHFLWQLQECIVVAGAFICFKLRREEGLLDFVALGELAAHLGVEDDLIINFAILAVVDVGCHSEN